MLEEPFVEHTDAVALFDAEVVDRVLGLVPALDAGLLVHDQGAEVARVEHDDVGGLGGYIEHHKGADQDTEANKYSYALAVCNSSLGSYLYRRYIVGINGAL